MVSGAGALGLKELRDILRERTIVMALVVQLFVAAFSAFLAVGLLALYDPGSVGTTPSMEVGYVGEGDFDDVLAAHPNLEPVPVTNRSQAVDAFRNGDLVALSEESAGNASIPRTVTLLLPEGEVQTSLLVNELKTALDDYEKQLRTEHADELEHAIVYADNDAQPGVSFTFAYSVLLPLLVATPVFLAGAITADAWSDEINEGTLLLLRSTPLSANAIVVGKMLAPVLLVPAQVILWIGLLGLNGIPVANIPLILIAATAMGALLAASGTLVAAIAQREGPTQAAYTVLVLALALLSLLLPQDPANVIARASVDRVTMATVWTIGAYVLMGLATLWVTVRIVARRLSQDQLQPGSY